MKENVCEQEKNNEKKITGDRKKQRKQVSIEEVERERDSSRKRYTDV